MFDTLYGKLVAVLLGLFAVAGALLIIVTRYTGDMYQQEVRQKLNRSLAQSIVAAHKGLLRDGRVNEPALEDLFHALMVINPSVEIYLLDPRGKILAFSAEPGRVKRHQVSLQPIKTFLAGGRPFPLLGDDPRGLERRKAFSVAPIATGGRSEGYLYIILGGEDYDSVAQRTQGSYIMRVALWSVGGILIVALVTGITLFGLITRRLTRLTAAVDSFRDADFTRPLTPTEARPGAGGDEIDRLSASFGAMATRITHQVGELRRTDAQRREMVANVSHDLRTPLASLQGYLDTILMKEGQLSAQERTQYVQIAARQSRHLGKLVGDLFELAKLDSLETVLQVEPFSLGELAQDIAQKYRLQAQDKGIVLRAQFQSDAPLVSADMGLMVRVLENLVENALRHTPQGGAISLALVPGGNTMTVRVSDTGHGIPEQELPHIFERFYRLEKSRGDSPGGAGLGLSIAKRILELHGTTIKAFSRLNAGTTFVFELPLAKPT